MFCVKLLLWFGILLSPLLAFSEADSLSPDVSNRCSLSMGEEGLTFITKVQLTWIHR